jgi:hypothetical protein
MPLRFLAQLLQQADAVEICFDNARGHVGPVLLGSSSDGDRAGHRRSSGSNLIDARRANSWSPSTRPWAPSGPPTKQIPRDGPVPSKLGGATLRCPGHHRPRRQRAHSMRCLGGRWGDAACAASGPKSRRGADTSPRLPARTGVAALWSPSIVADSCPRLPMRTDD